MYITWPNNMYTKRPLYWKDATELVWIVWNLNKSNTNQFQKSTNVT